MSELSTASSKAVPALLFAAMAFTYFGVTSHVAFFFAANICLSLCIGLQSKGMTRAIAYAFAVFGLVWLGVAGAYGVGKDMAQRDNARDQIEQPSTR